MNKWLPIIEGVLIESELARDNDLVLAYKVFEKISSNIVTMNLGAILRRIENKEIPSFDTISRLGRKLKKENENLRGKTYQERLIHKQAKARKDLNYDN